MEKLNSEIENNQREEQSQSLSSLRLTIESITSDAGKLSSDDYILNIGSLFLQYLNDERLFEILTIKMGENKQTMERAIKKESAVKVVSDLIERMQKRMQDSWVRWHIKKEINEANKILEKLNSKIEGSQREGQSQLLSSLRLTIESITSDADELLSDCFNEVYPMQRVLLKYLNYESVREYVY